MAIINGNNLANVLIGTNDAGDTISGLAGNDVLIGLAGNDLLNGGTGADVMVGGAGNDSYIVDDVGDSVAEAANEGIDRVVSSVSFSLSAAGRFDIENLTLSGAAAVFGIGNSLNNFIVGNNANNFLSGLGGVDTMFGLGGNDSMFGGSDNDVMFGGSGNDLLNGGTGADMMRGEAGDDTYVVDNVGDNVIEVAGAGTDLIQSSISTSLSVAGRFDVENLTLTGGALTGVGNALNNMTNGNALNNTLFGLAGNDSMFGLGGNDNMFGGTGNDFLDGGIGADTMRGEAGNDVYVVDNVGDVVIEAAAAGIDRIQSSISTSLSLAGRLDVENLTLTGAAAINGTGNAQNNVMIGNNANNVMSGLGGNDSMFGLGGNDFLFGGTGNDFLSGGSGNDFLSGGTGNDTISTGTGFDTIRFDSALVAGNVDSITDFSPVSDTVQLENAEFTALAAGALAATAFRIGATALDGTDRIIYNSVTGALSYDPDGFGGIAQVQFATLSAGLAMTAADFFVV